MEAIGKNFNVFVIYHPVFVNRNNMTMFIVISNEGSSFKNTWFEPGAYLEANEDINRWLYKSIEMRYEIW